MSDADGPVPPGASNDASRAPYVRDLLHSVLSVALVGLFAFAVSGVWPPLVAIESESMEPNVGVGDLVFVMDEERFPGDAQEGETGVVTAHAGADSDYTSLGGPGDVIVFAPDGDDSETPVIHRAMFWVEDGENWYDEADPGSVGDADDCESLSNCPAPHAGFVTKGDNARTNDRYDQAQGISGPVKPAWVVGTAEARVPWLGCLRLRATGTANSPAECEVFGR